MTYEEFAKVLNQAGPKFEKALKDVSIKSAFRLEADAKLNATTYPKVITGRLRSSIQGRLDQGNILLQAGGPAKGQTVDYAGYVEFGTSRIAPRLFMGRAVDKEQPRLQKELAKLLKIAFKR